LPKDYEGTLKQLAAMGYREVEAAGFFGRSPSEVKQAMEHAGLHCVSAHYSLSQLLPKVDETIQFGKDLGLEYIVCAAPMLKDPSRAKEPGSRAARESMTLDDWRWNADQFNRIGEKVNAAGMRFAYHNHTPEFRAEKWCDVLRRTVEVDRPAKVSMELDCGWAVVAGQIPQPPVSLSNTDLYAAREGLQDDTSGDACHGAKFNGVGPRHHRLPSHLRSSEEG